MQFLGYGLTILTATLIAGTATAQPGKPRVDRFGDPLPQGALFRIGTNRLYLDGTICAMAASPDGKRIAALSRDFAVVWELPGGREIVRIPAHSDAPWTLTFSPDGSKLAVNEHGELSVFDLPAGKRIASFDREAMRAAFTPDGKAITAIRWGGPWDIVVECCDLTTQAAITRYQIDNEASLKKDAKENIYEAQVCISRDGKLIGTIECNRHQKKQLIRVHDALTGKEIRRWPVEMPLMFHLDFSPDGKMLLAVSEWYAEAKRGELCAWDTETGKELCRALIPKGLFTGHFVQGVHCDSIFCTETGAVVRYELKTEEPLKRYPMLAGPLAFVGTEALIAHGPNGLISVVDIESGKDLCPLWRAGRFVALSADGQRLAWPEGGAIVLADLPSGKELRRWKAHDHFAEPLAFSPEGKTLASAGTDGRIRIWDVETGQEKRSIPRKGIGSLFFAPDSRRLVSTAFGEAHIWDVETGVANGVWRAPGNTPVIAPDVQAVTVHQMPDFQKFKQVSPIRVIDPASGKLLWEQPNSSRMVEYVLETEIVGQYPIRGPFPPCFTPDSKRVLMPGPANEQQPDKCSTLHLWDVASGKRMSPAIYGGKFILDCPAFSPDGRLLAMLHVDCRMAVLEMTNGEVVRTLGKTAEPTVFVGDTRLTRLTAPAFSRDGRTLITAGRNRLQFWEIATGGEIALRDVHRGDIRELIVSADGRRLATTSIDHTVLIWDLNRLVTEPGSPLPALDTLWKNLAEADAAKGRRAIELLAGEPTIALPLLRDRLKPAPVPDPKKLAGWIADLGSDDFDLRENAQDELARIVETASPALQKALDAKPPLEARRRIETLLKKLDPSAIPTGDALRSLRAVQVLEMIGSAEARAVLESLAKGAAGSRQTEDAKASLDRLSRY